ncbi:hypothetical protein [Flavobacterium sp. 270]
MSFFSKLALNSSIKAFIFL